MVHQVAAVPVVDLDLLLQVGLDAYLGGSLPEVGR